MPRRKVTLAYMLNKSERKISFNKRKKGLIKKASELRTLRAVDACAIIYSPHGSQPEVWPSPEDTTTVLSRYNGLSDTEKSRYLTNLESLTQQRLKKVKKELHRLQIDNKRKEVENFMYKCMAGIKKPEEFDMANADVMRSIMEQTVRDLSSRMRELNIADLDNPSTTGSHNNN
ncbi:hypothetical protein RD792_011571 [Penstemon davidsonii]|uniref:MADS-box domain-containing protein n=1 Tax=Penstemon davidsonii TaxID=160366 RepID=A0ABR0CYE7_9LAMI|nr:hypothetical protein RD792_011571 [Penstemon davidsonii]